MDLHLYHSPMFKFLTGLLDTCLQTKQRVLEDKDMIIFYPNGMIKYIGECQDGKRHGKGKMYFSDGKLYYEGSWRNNKREGYGTSYFYDNFSYSGFWINNKPHGRGELSYGSYLFYQGQFSFGKFHGYGTKYFIPDCPNCPRIEKNLVEYEGIWKFGLRNGMGVSYEYYVVHGIVFHQLKYKGYFLQDKYHGDGTLYFSNNITFKKQFVGNFLQGYFHGQGTLYYINGVKAFVGQFFEGKKHGDGLSFNEKGILVSSTTYIHGLSKDEYEKRNSIKVEMNIRSFLDTKLKKYIHNISAKELREFIEQTYGVIMDKEDISKDRILSFLESIDLRKKNSKETIISDDEEEIDLFGNVIKTKVKGSDGNIYDLSSMLYLFEKDEKGQDYVNMTYRYENEKRVPNYPTMANGKILESYQLL